MFVSILHSFLQVLLIALTSMLDGAFAISYGLNPVVSDRSHGP